MMNDEIVGSISQIVEENHRLVQEMEIMKHRCIDTEKFYAVAVGVEIVAKMHNVSTQTVRKYIEMGLIERHPNSMDAKLVIRMSDALRLDFGELKRQAARRAIAL